MRRNALTMVAGLVLLVFVTALVGCSPAMNNGVSASVGGVPVFEVDPFWPKPLPNNWLMGQAAGVAVDKRNHVWVVQRPKSLTDDEKGATLTPPRSLCCRPAPPVLEFDQSGALVQSWGGPAAGQPWPENEHGIYVDDQDNVWLAGNGPKDGMILKFTRAGKLLLKIGEPGVIGDDKDTQRLNRPANMVVDPATRELIVADGYGNHRVIVFDADTGSLQAPLGRQRPTPRRPERQGLRQSRALRASLARRADLRLRPHEQPHPGVPQGRHLRARVHRGAGDARQRLDVGPRPLDGLGADAPLHR